MEVVLDNVSGKHHLVVLTTAAQLVLVRPRTNRQGGRFQVRSNHKWYYSSVDRGADTDAWVLVGPGETATYDSGTRFAFYAAAVSGTPYLHIVEA